MKNVFYASEYGAKLDSNVYTGGGGGGGGESEIQAVERMIQSQSRGF